ncbi:TetR/AcrR family transcriptional regulator [Streptomyces sp. NRRL F-5123]|uniref:TetR/AcrR family transcriptional regulator n=1 Tax=Streptomyces sp. NRRL F-5123 TaxID=1463856 RepID=UPI0004E26941|nr:TetR family transcriptional regulator C-terminal domain-containing protein [Streptomyces sp. NRRL F-5123]
MPKVVDHEERRAELAGALWRVALREGFDAVSVRSVARESGWSAGALRHYFADKTAMVLFAVDHAVAAVRERVAAANAAAGALSPEFVQTHLEQLLPLDDERRLESEAWFALVVLAHRDPAAAERRAEVDDLIRDSVESAVAALAELGRLGEGRVLAAEAARLHALLDGLVLQLLARPTRLTPPRARALLAGHLADLAHRAG